jgi:hypothetical protein
MVFTIDFSKNVTSVRSPSFDLAAFFDSKTLYSAFNTFHFWHMLTPLIILELRQVAAILFSLQPSSRKWDGIISKYAEIFIMTISTESSNPICDRIYLRKNEGSPWIKQQKYFYKKRSF